MVANESAEGVAGAEGLHFKMKAKTGDLAVATYSYQTACALNCSGSSSDEREVILARKRPVQALYLVIQKEAGKEVAQLRIIDR